mmetsp:Transcript_71900/g.142533  ORF Transcript_71900/g.142533 Transcript_71900/m.142533 type:complete len:279 (+) Transcript_71900:1457-2293(+)
MTRWQPSSLPKRTLASWVVSSSSGPASRSRPRTSTTHRPTSTRARRSSSTSSALCCTRLMNTPSRIWSPTPSRTRCPTWPTSPSSSRPSLRRRKRCSRPLSRPRTHRARALSRMICCRTSSPRTTWSSPTRCSSHSCADLTSTRMATSPTMTSSHSPTKGGGRDEASCHRRRSPGESRLVSRGFASAPLAPSCTAAAARHHRRALLPPDAHRGLRLRARQIMCLCCRQGIGRDAHSRLAALWRWRRVSSRIQEEGQRPSADPGEWLDTGRRGREVWIH